MIAIRNEVLLHVADNQLEVVLVHVEDLKVVVALAAAVGPRVDQLGQLHAPLQHRLPLAANHVPIVSVDHNKVDVGIHDDGHPGVDGGLAAGIGRRHHVRRRSTRGRSTLYGVYVVAIGAESKWQHHPIQLSLLVVVVVFVAGGCFLL